MTSADRPAAGRDGPDDEMMASILETFRDYTLMVLRPGPNRRMAGVDDLIHEHGRRNLRLRADGVLAVVMPIGDETISGIGIFRTGLDETRAIIDGDPAVMAGVFVAEFHEASGFPGDRL